MKRVGAEYIIAGLALLAVAVMVSWWAVLAHRLVATTIDLRQQLHLAQTGTTVDLSTQHDRMRLMVVSEFGAIALALGLAIAALLYVTRQRSLANLKMERLLQFTSHELKTPIAGVRALLQTLGLDALPAEKKAEFIRRGIAETDRLEHLAEAILTWQRSVAHVDQLAPVPVDGCRLVTEVLAHRELTGVSEQVTVGQLAQAVVVADGDAFRVILENLLDNARKYGAGKTWLDATVDGERWHLSVRDQGDGFGMKDAQQLFDPFRRHRHEGVTHGSGLGLYLARQLARRMRGDVTAISEGPGRGATFTISLPREVASG
jgi:two-component system, OmpR family, sensor histidine kinase BaeS